jgi:hypothetical protein
MATRSLAIHAGRRLENEARRLFVCLCGRLVVRLPALGCRCATLVLRWPAKERRRATQRLQIECRRQWRTRSFARLGSGSHLNGCLASQANQFRAEWAPRMLTKVGPVSGEEASRARVVARLHYEARWLFWDCDGHRLSDSSRLRLGSALRRRRSSPPHRSSTPDGARRAVRQRTRDAIMTKRR